MGKTVTLYDYLESEWNKSGKNDFFNGDELTLENITYFNDDDKFMKKVLLFDPEIKELTNTKIFMNLSLETSNKDDLFKKAFLHRFLHRQINRQTIEAFVSQVIYTFMANEDFINRIYNDLDFYLLGKTTSNQDSTNTSTTDNRSAFSQLPQNNVHLDVDSTVMTTANDNTISRNKQATKQNQETENSQYKLDELIKINGLIDMILDTFDKNCFLQTW